VTQHNEAQHDPLPERCSAGDCDCVRFITIILQVKQRQILIFVTPRVMKSSSIGFSGSSVFQYTVFPKACDLYIGKIPTEVSSLKC